MTTSQQVYYRKWRPGTFSELAGQEHIAKTLRLAVVQNRVAHSYLLCGTRGSGKTTTARVIAKAVNCLDSQNGDPCDQCEICTSINEGRNMDIIELDAASNRGVEEIREIRDKVHFRPSQSRRKVYIIDEAHMLTREASNAFLKTLEEPPEHVIFILCTTEADRLLPTILSRCQRYDFRPLPGQTIHDRLKYITEQESVKIQPDALRMIARNSSGSMRDALNILEQLTVSDQEEIVLQDVEESLGLVRSDAYLTLTSKLLASDTLGALEIINEVVWEGGEPRQIHRQTLELLRYTLLISWNASQTIDIPDDTMAALRETARNADPDHILRAMDVWGEASIGLRYDAPSPVTLEVAAAQICRPQAYLSHNNTTDDRPRESRSERPREEDRDNQEYRSHNENAPPPRSSTRAPEPEPPPRITPMQEHWEKTVRQLGRARGAKYNLGALLRDCRTEAIRTTEDDTLIIPFRNAVNLDRMNEELDRPGTRETIEETIALHFGRKITFQVTQDDGNSEPKRQDVSDNVIVQAAIGIGGRIIRN